MRLFKKTKWRKKILFISSPITTKVNETETLDYFAYIVSFLSQKIENIFPEYDLVVKVPEEDANPTDKQIKIINNTIKTINGNQDEYEVIIISPNDKTKLDNEIVKLCKTEKKVLLIDQGYSTNSEKSIFYSNDLHIPPFVQSDWVKGGELAGEALKEYLIKNKIAEPNILIIEGGVGSIERINGFQKALETQNVKYFEPIINGNYTRQNSVKVFSNFLKKHSVENINVIFCTNDAMALGVREVLTNIKGLSNGKRPIIIGYDGIRDFTLPMNLGDPFLFATVDVKLTKQIDILSEMLNNCFNNKSEKIENLVPPQILINKSMI